MEDQYLSNVEAIKNIQGNLYGLSPEDLRGLAHLTQRLMDRIFEEVHKQSFWLTRDLKLVYVDKIEPDHLWNILNMLKKKAQAQATETVGFYMAGPEPNGDMAMEAYLGEQKYVFENAEFLWLEKILSHPLYSRLHERAKAIGLPLDGYPEPIKEDN
jgi:hypothetical protein